MLLQIKNRISNRLEQGFCWPFKSDKERTGTMRKSLLKIAKKVRI